MLANFSSQEWNSKSLYLSSEKENVIKIIFSCSRPSQTSSLEILRRSRATTRGTQRLFSAKYLFGEANIT